MKKKLSYLFLSLFVLILTDTTSEVSARPLLSSDMTEAHTPTIVFLISEDINNYEAHKTIPVYAKLLAEQKGYNVKVLLGRGTHGAFMYPDFEKVIPKADLIVVFSRRVAIPHQQMNLLKKHLKKGKPVIGIRTANHAFTAWDEISDGYEDWPGFVDSVLGCKNRGYGPVEPGTDVSIVPGEYNHPIVKGITEKSWHSEGNVYLVQPLLDEQATVLLTGKVNDITEPIAWTRRAGKSKVFYTSLGYPKDFESPQFISLLNNAIQWALLP